MTDYLQAKSIQGYKIHAVPANAERTGLHASFVWAQPICGTIKGRTTGLMPNMRLDPTPKPFTFDAADFRDASRICKACVNEIIRREV